MKDIDLVKLKELAIKAGGDEWEYQKFLRAHHVVRKGTREEGPGYLSFEQVTNEIDDLAVAQFIAVACPSLVVALIEQLEAVQRERDEVGERLALVREQRDAEINRNAVLEAELKRRDDAVPVAWQFFDNGEWHTGSEKNNHRQNTEAAGYQVRDLYAATAAVLPEKVVKAPGTKSIGWVRDAIKEHDEKWKAELAAAGVKVEGE